MIFNFTERIKKQHVQFNDDTASTTSESAESINNGMEESWIVAPPQCFNSKGKFNAEMNPMENLLIEHPSMSIYHEKSEKPNGNNENHSNRIVVISRQEKAHRAVAGRLLQLEDRVPLKDINNKVNKSKNSSPNALKRRNMVYGRSHGTRQNKQYGRMVGKHVGMVGKRGS